MIRKCAMISIGVWMLQSGQAVELHFSVRFLGGRFEVTEELPQEGDDLGMALAPESFVSVTIAQDSGKGGFDSVRLFADGSGYVVCGGGGRMGERLPIQLSETEIEDLYGALNRDGVLVFPGRYETTASDGAQGFLEIETKAGRRVTSFSNHFEPVENLYGF